MYTLFLSFIVFFAISSIGWAETGGESELVTSGFCAKVFAWDRSASSVTLGDVDNNGAVNFLDVIQTARASLGLSIEESFSVATADINQDGAINVFGVIKAARLALGLSTNLEQSRGK